MSEPPQAEVEAEAKSAIKRGSVMKSSLVFAGMTLISRVLGFVRDLAVSYHMGASATPAADAWNTALAFPNLFRRIFAEGAFAAAFVPAYAKAIEKDGEAKADELAGDAMAVLAAATIVLTLVAELAMPWLMALINPGYLHDPVKYKLAVLLTQITMPYLPCMAIYAHLSGVLNARGKFALSAFAPALLNIGTLIAILPQKTAGGAAVAASIGAFASGIAQAAVLSWGVKKSGAAVHWRFPRLTPEIKALIGLAVPGAIAASATQVNVFVSGILASQVNGARSWLAAADRLYQLPLGLVGVAIGVALLPQLARAVQADDKPEAKRAMDQALLFALALTLPAAAALIAMPIFLIDGLFTRGEFRYADAVATGQALFQYGWGVPAFVLARVLAPAFFARQDTKAPMRMALVSVVVNIVGGIAFYHLFGFQGIAAATSLAAWINVIQMVIALKRRGLYEAHARVAWRMFRVLLAAAGLAVILGLAQHFRGVIQAPLEHVRLGPIHAKEIAVLLTVLVGAALYPPLLFAFGGLKVSDVKGALRRRAAPAQS